MRCCLIEGGQKEGQPFAEAGAVLAALFQSNHRLGHPDNSLFLISKNIFTGSKHPKIIIFFLTKASLASSRHQARSATGNFAVADVSLRSPRNVYICMEKLIINEIHVSQSIYFNFEIIITGGYGLEPPRLLKAICSRSGDSRQ